MKEKSVEEKAEELILGLGDFIRADKSVNRGLQTVEVLVCEFIAWGEKRKLRRYLDKNIPLSEKYLSGVNTFLEEMRRDYRLVV